MPSYSKSDQLRKKKQGAQSRTEITRAYQEATERARHPAGFLVCQECGHSIPDGQENRHHVTLRSQGGKTTPDNLRILCGPCHGQKHGRNHI